MMDFDISTEITRDDESIGAEGGVRRIRVVDQKVDIARCSREVGPDTEQPAQAPSR